MRNIYLLCGEELVFKDLRYKEILHNLEYFEEKIIYIESYRTKKVDIVYKDANEFLNTFDLFSNCKVLRVVVYKPEQVKQLLKNISILKEDSILIIDLRCPEYLCKKVTLSFNGESLEIEKFYKFKDYEKEKVFKFMKKWFVENSIKFNNESEALLAMEYIFNNAQYSYDSIYTQIEKIKMLGDKNISFRDVNNVIGTLPNRNNYRICDEIFYSKDIGHTIEYMETNIKLLNQKNFLNLINVLLTKMSDFNLFKKGLKCSNKANYYVFKESLLVVENYNSFVTDLNKLSLKMKKENSLLKEEFLWILIKHIKYKKNN